MSKQSIIHDHMNTNISPDKEELAFSEAAAASH